MDEQLKAMEELREVTQLLERKIAVAAKLSGRTDIEVSTEPSMHAENTFLRAENELLKLKMKQNEDLMQLVIRQSVMVSVVY